jgi:amino acid adenylation domain-containing protein/non-ribosomal peptide synthase protein (TIGR01720 family)
VIAQAFELSVQQKVLWRTPGAAESVVACVVEVEGALEPSRVREALERACQRHDVLRTVFRRVEGFALPRQVVLESLAPRWEEERPAPGGKLGTWVESLAASAREVKLDLELGPVVYARFVSLSPSMHLLLLALPLVCADERTLHALVAELAGDAGEEEPVQYVDFAAWQREVLAEQSTVPPARTAGEDAPLVLPLESETAEGGIFTRTLSLSAGALSEACTRAGCSREAFLLSAWALLMHRLTGLEQVPLSFVHSGRTQEELRGAPGHFEVDLPLLSTLDASAPFSGLLARTSELLEQAESELDGRLHALDVGGATLAGGVAFSFIQAGLAGKGSGVRWRISHSQHGLSGHSLRLDVHQEDGALRVVAHAGKRLGRELVERLLERYETLLGSALVTPEAPTSTLEFLGEQEHRLLKDFASGGPAGFMEGTLHGRLQEQAARAPEQPAVVDGARVLSMRELDRKANGLARRLRELGAGPGSPVGLLLERSAEMLVSVFGILKAGSAYLPIDPDYPSERVALMLDDGRPPVVITQRSLRERLVGYEGQVLCLEEGESPLREEDAPPAVTVGPGDLAYVLYTSGSTGVPKGVAVHHGAVLNLLAALRTPVHGEAPAPGPRNVAMNGPLAFDTSVKQLVQVLDGHTLHVIRAALRLDAEALFTFFREHRIDVVDCTPSQLRLWLDAAPEERGWPGCVLVGGEAIDTELWAKLAARTATRFVNLYGPTECTVDAASCVVRPGTAPMLGRPLGGVEIHITDAHLHPVPIGSTGELVIGGAGVAQGYYRHPELTAERFVSLADGRRVYRTGDLARWRSDGTLEFLGRADSQVKIRGHRVELGEIEAAVRAHPHVARAVVLAPGQDGKERRVAAYVVPVPGSELSRGGLREFLVKRLPDYMVPASFTFLEALPLNAHGKVDTRKLPAPRESSDTGRVKVAARTAVETLLAGVWRAVLNVPEVGIHDSFFELGGDSIMCIQVVVRARQQGLVVPLPLLFRHQTIAALAEALEGSRPAVASEQGEVSGQVPLTPIQRRFFERELDERHHWNQALLLEPGPSVTAAKLEAALRAVARHHDALRLRFQYDGQAWQQTHGPAESVLSFATVDVSGLEESARRAAIERETARLQAGMDLARGPLMRAAYFDAGPGVPGRLFVAVHHLVFDGVSWRIFLEDMEAVLERGESALPPKTTSYQRWASVLEAQTRAGRFDGELQHWRAQASAAVPLPRDSEGENTQASRRVLVADLEEAPTRVLTQELLRVGRFHVQEALLASLALAVRRGAGQRSLRVDVERHGREEQLFEGVDLSRTIGWFTSVFPVGLRWGEEGDEAALQAAREALRAVPNGGVGYGALRYLSSPGAELASLPRAEVSFNFLGHLDEGGGEGRLRVVDEPVGASLTSRGRRLYALEVDALIVNGRLRVMLAYSEALHRRQTIERLAGDMLDSLRRWSGRVREGWSDRRRSPGDFPLVRLDRPRLEGLLRRFPSLTEILPATASQRAMLEALSERPRPGQYVFTTSFGLEGELDPVAFEAAWQQAVDEAPALRASFVTDDPAAPLLIIQSGLQVRVPVTDLSTLPPEARPSAIEARVDEARARGIELNRPPLLSLSLLRLGERLHQLVATFTTVAVDLTSFFLVLERALALHRAKVAGGTVAVAPLQEPTPYLEYLSRLPPDAARAFWTRYLEGWRTPLALADLPDVPPERPERYVDRMAELSAATTTKLRAEAQRAQVTLNTLLQAAWALVLRSATGQDDVVFGATVSGRPAQVEDVQQRVGRFLNVVPIRAKMEDRAPVLSWLRQLQAVQFERMQHDHAATADIQRWCGVPRSTPLFDSHFIYESYPLTDEAKGGLGITGEPVFAGYPEIPLKVEATPLERLRLTLAYVPSRVTRARAEALLQALTARVARLAEGLGGTVGDLLQEEKRQW